MERRKARHLPLKVPTIKMLRPTALHHPSASEGAAKPRMQAHRENEYGCLKIESVIPGRAEGAGPESMNTFHAILLRGHGKCDAESKSQHSIIH